MTARWLTATQQRQWRAFLLGSTLLMDRIDRDMREKHGLSQAEYELLVRLSEAPERVLRMAELADSVKNSRSRVTHTIRRLEEAGFVARRACESDGRGVQAVLTDAGFAKLVAAAPDHVDCVRECLVDVVDADDLETIGRAFGHVADRLETGAPDLGLRCST
jgi:DNA-binding MarR family transcriptional regulator